MNGTELPRGRYPPIGAWRSKKSRAIRLNPERPAGFFVEHGIEMIETIHFQRGFHEGSMNKYIEVSINGAIQNDSFFLRENPTKIDDLGVPLFQETPIYVDIKYI